MSEPRRRSTLVQEHLAESWPL